MAKGLPAGTARAAGLPLGGRGSVTGYRAALALRRAETSRLRTLRSSGDDTRSGKKLGILHPVEQRSGSLIRLSGWPAHEGRQSTCVQLIPKWTMPRAGHGIYEEGFCSLRVRM